MSATTRGDDSVPPVTPATPDIICWLRAAVPPKDGRGVNAARVNVKRTAEILDIDPSTLRRWIREAPDLEINMAALKTLRRFAILRGHGHLLWPELDPATAARAARLATKARRSYELSQSSPATAAQDPKMTRPTEVLQYHAPDAMVIGVATGAPKERRRALVKVGCIIISEITVPSFYAAQVVKYAALELAGSEVCIPPRHLLPTGRTEVWRQRAGTLDLPACATASGIQICSSLPG